ncbi:MAG: hypothetical protein QM723_04700 [Myxococcaceae bacterium]
MATYTAYWPEWMCSRAIEQGLEGKPLHLLWGGYNADSSFSHSKVGPGDTVVPITCREGVLHALASLDVVEKTDGDRWLARHPEDAAKRMHGCGNEVLAGKPGAALRFDRELSAEQLKAWRYDSPKAPRALKYVEKGRLMRTVSAQGVYRVTAETAQMLEQVLSAPRADPPKTDASRLEEKLRDAPEDEATARVLADAWQSSGDPRGELLTLELALRTERDLEKAAQLDAALTAIANKSPGLKKKAGGFPFRSVWGARELIDVHVTPDLKPVPVEVAMSFVRGFIAAEGFTEFGSRSQSVDLPLEKVIRTLGGRRGGDTHQFTQAWTRDEPFTVDEVKQCLAVARQHRLEAAALGPVVKPGTQIALPLQARTLWLGSALRSEVRVSFAGSSLVEAALRLQYPAGASLCEEAADEIERGFAAKGVTLRRNRLRRTVRGLTRQS